MLSINTSKSINATSRVDGVDIATMYATISADGAISINKNVMNNDMYKQNLETVQNDMIEFENKVYAMQNDEITDAATESTTEG